MTDKLHLTRTATIRDVTVEIVEITKPMTILQVFFCKYKKAFS